MDMTDGPLAESSYLGRQSFADYALVERLRDQGIQRLLRVTVGLSPVSIGRLISSAEDMARAARNP